MLPVGCVDVDGLLDKNNEGGKGLDTEMASDTNSSNDTNNDELPIAN